MSERDYNAILRTPLSQLKLLPADLRLQYLARCPRCIMAAIIKQLSR